MNRILQKIAMIGFSSILLSFPTYAILMCFISGCKEPDNSKEQKIAVNHTAVKAPDTEKSININDIEDTTNSDYNSAVETTLQMDTGMQHQPESVAIGGSKHKQRPFVVYKKRFYTRRSPKMGFGKYEYWITDATIYNWRYVTDDDNIDVGDTIKFLIIKKK